MDVLGLKTGDVVEIRSLEEILATLDGAGSIDGLPFMPEMIRYCGLRARVSKRADKACDTIHYGGSRRMHDAVHLENLRCDGRGHGGCDAWCLMYWKEAWLKRVETGDRGLHDVRSSQATSDDFVKIPALLERAVWQPDSTDEAPRVDRDDAAAPAIAEGSAGELTDRSDERSSHERPPHSA